MEGFPSGQRGQTVNLLAQPSEVRILPPPPGCVEFPRQCAHRAADSMADLIRLSRGCSSMVEPQPSKLMMWVRSPSPAPGLNVRTVRMPRSGVSNVGRICVFAEGGNRPGCCAVEPRGRLSVLFPGDAHIAQSVEHFLGKEEVTGSNPVVGSMDFRRDAPATRHDAAPRRD
jgi:hypothetical protein